MKKWRVLAILREDADKMIRDKAAELAEEKRRKKKSRRVVANRRGR